jgi:hypothetical protein
MGASPGDTPGDVPVPESRFRGWRKTAETTITDTTTATSAATISTAGDVGEHESDRVLVAAPLTAPPRDGNYQQYGRDPVDPMPFHEIDLP